MKVCILGAAGLIGSHLCGALSAAGHHVFGATLTSPPPAGLDLIGWDNAATPSADVLAWGMPWDLVIDGRAYQPSDLVGLTSQAGDLTARWIHLSSIYVYRRLRDAWDLGESFVPVPIREDSPCLPSGCYGEGKLACERLWQAAYDERQAPVTILRLPFVFGPMDRSGRIEFYAQKIVGEQEIPLPRAGSAHVDLLFAEDAVNMILDVATQPDAIGQIYNVVAGAPRQLSDHLNALASVLHRRARIAAWPAACGADEAPPFAYPIDIVLDGSRLHRLVGQMRATAPEVALRKAIGPRYET